MSEQAIEAPAAPATEAPAAESTPAPTPEPVRPGAGLHALLNKEAEKRASANGQNELQRKEQWLKQQEEFLKLDPVGFAISRGVDPSQFQQTQEQKPEDPFEAERREIAELKKFQQQTLQEKQEIARQEAILSLREDTQEYIASDTAKDRFPLTAGTKSGAGLVSDVILNHINTTGEDMSADDAAQQVEEFLSGLVDELTELPDVQSRFSPAPVAPKTKPTLSNSLAAANPTRTAPEQELIPRDQSLQLLIQKHYKK